MKKVLFNISPLTCEFCANELESLLMTHEGIRTGKVFNKLGKVWCSYNEAMVKPEEIEKLIQEAEL